MPSTSYAGPKHPVGLILLISVVIATAAGLPNRNMGLFILVLFGCLAGLVGLYMAVRRRLGWRPLDDDALASLSFLPWM
jgi:hypothetical protein